jgi:hypothetical protein
MTITQIAAKIDAHLKRWQADPAINKTIHQREMRLKTFCMAGCHRAGRFIQITYVSYIGHHSLVKFQAEKYLEWIEAGNVGYHWDAMEEEE